MNPDIHRMIDAVWRVESARLIAGLTRLVRDSYHLLPGVRGDLLAIPGRFSEACEEFARGTSLTRNVRERELLLETAAAMTKESQNEKVEH